MAGSSAAGSKPRRSKGGQDLRAWIRRVGPVPLDRIVSIFLAHSSADKRFVRRLAGDLLTSGVVVWFDEAEMLVGDSLIERIASGISASDYLGVILSPASVTSRWVQHEVEIALIREMKDGGPVVLPLLYRKCEVPSFLAPKLWLDFTSSRKYSQALKRLLDRLAPDVGAARKLLGTWTPDGVRYGVMCELLRTDGQAIVMSDRLIDSICSLGRAWSEGHRRFDKQGLFALHAVLSTLADANGQEVQLPLTTEEATYLFDEISRQVGNLELELSVRVRAVVVTKDGIAVRADFLDQLRSTLAAHAEGLVGHPGRLHRFVLRWFVEAVVRGLAQHYPAGAAHAHHVAMFIYSMYRDTDEYRKLKEIVRAKPERRF